MNRSLVIGAAAFGVVVALFAVLAIFGQYGLLGLFMGLIVHAFKSLLTAKRATGDASGINPITYFTKYWVEAGTALACAFGIWFALPELAAAFGDYTKVIGLTPTTAKGYLPGFMAGMFGDMIADFLGARVRKLYTDSANPPPK